MGWDGKRNVWEGITATFWHVIMAVAAPVHIYCKGYGMS